MTYCYPVWTAAPRAAVHHIARRFTHHTIRHAALATVRIVCVAAPVWLATPSPASAPVVPGGLLEYPPMLPWPEGDEAPWGWGDMPPGGLAPGFDHVGEQPGGHMPSNVPDAAYPTDDMPSHTFTSRTFPISDALPPGQPVPEPWGVGVLGMGLLFLGIFKGVRR